MPEHFLLPFDQVIYKHHTFIYFSLPYPINSLVSSGKFLFLFLLIPHPLMLIPTTPNQFNSLVSSESLIWLTSHPSVYSLPSNPWFAVKFTLSDTLFHFFRNHVRKTWETLRRIGSLISMMKRSSPPSVEHFLIQQLLLEDVVYPYKEFTWGGAAMESHFLPCRKNL